MGSPCGAQPGEDLALTADMLGDLLLGPAHALGDVRSCDEDGFSSGGDLRRPGDEAAHPALLQTLTELGEGIELS